MSKTTTLTMHFFLDGQLYVSSLAIIPKYQSEKIPQLMNISAIVLPPKNIKKVDNYNYDHQAVDNDMVDEMENQQIEEVEDENPNDLINNDNDEEVERVLKEVQMELEEEQLGDDEDEDVDSDEQSLSVIQNKFKTKRQKGLYEEFVELPDKKFRKKKGDEMQDIVRKEEKEQKRKQYLKKQVQAQEKATLDKILNEQGRKLRLREEKFNKEQNNRTNRQFRNLGDIPKITTISTASGHHLILHKTQLFPHNFTRDIKMKQPCSSCKISLGKYRIKDSQNYACSVQCYQKLTKPIK